MDFENYIILTNTIPEKPYPLLSEYCLRPVKTTKRIFVSYGNMIPHQYAAVMAFNHINTMSHAIWKDLVMFHSFLCDDPETFDYAEQNIRMSTQTFSISDSSFVSSQNYFYERYDFKTEQNQKFAKTKRINAIDFDNFPIEVYPTTKEIFTDLESQPINYNISASEAEFYSKEIEPEYKQIVNYRRAFELFRNLRKIDNKLYNQICLYVFSGNLKEYGELYDNDYASISFYISILESQVGNPPTCTNKIDCDVCGRKHITHGSSIEKHLIDKFGSDFKNLHHIRNVFFHHGEYYSSLENIWDVYDTRQIAQIQNDNELRML